MVSLGTTMPPLLLNDLYLKTKTLHPGESSVRLTGFESSKHYTVEHGYVFAAEMHTAPAEAESRF